MNILILPFFESYFYEFAYICDVIKVPFVVMDPIITNPYASWLMRTDRNAAYYPGNFVDFDQHMTFIERLQSTLANIDGFIKNGILQWLVDPSPEWSDHIPFDKSSTQTSDGSKAMLYKNTFCFGFPATFAASRDTNGRSNGTTFAAATTGIFHGTCKRIFV